MMKRMIALMMVLLLAGALAGCGAGGNGDASSSAQSASAPASEPASQPADAREPVTMLLAAAASLEDSFVSTLIPMFTAEHSWITVQGSYDASGKLQTQIEEGLEASVFMSAATKQMNALVEGGQIDPASVVELLENEIVLIAPIDSETTISSFEQIIEADAIALGDPESVPAGQYAQEALTSLGVYDAVAGRASFGTNVTEVLTAVAEGSADVGIVYATDAAQMPDRVKVIATAPEGSLANKVIYPVGILAEAPQREAAELFLSFLQSPEAIEVFVANGFRANV